MKAGDAFPSPWLKHDDLRGRQIPVVITRVAMAELKEMDGSVTHKPACHFQGAEKALILNITNWNSIAELYGDDSDMWTGREVVLYSARVPFGPKMVDGIRVMSREQATGQAAARAAPATSQGPFGGNNAQAPLTAPPANPLGDDPNAPINDPLPPLGEGDRIESNPRDNPLGNDGIDF